MGAHWLKFEGKPSGCVEADSEEEAKQIGAELMGAAVLECSRLPYPASPRINTKEHKGGVVCPSFCYQPQRCKGLTSCPDRRSCVD